MYALRVKEIIWRLIVYSDSNGAWRIIEKLISLKNVILNAKTMMIILKGSGERGIQLKYSNV